MEYGLRVQLMCDDPGAWLPRIEGGLRARDVRVTNGAPTERARRPVTLLLFDVLSPAVLASVTEASRGGRDRTLAVATHRDALGDVGAWALLRSGASDAFAWDETGDPMAQVAARLERWSRIDGLIETPAVRRELVGGSPNWVACLRQAVEVAVFSDGPVLLLGESGTGKELLARLIHSLDPRRDKGELIVLDCTTVVPDLSGSEFFGHERGAFTGAATARDGAFALADGGTLFLDEVGDLPLPLQAQLLRVVQERTYKRVGSNVWQRTNFRLVCATHRDLKQDVAAGRFRADFYHRIASRICHLPPLRTRREDILPLAQRFLQSLTRADDCPSFDRSVARFLVDRDYPGNVRELRQLVERIGDRHVGPGPITTGDVPEDEWAVMQSPAALSSGVEPDATDATDIIAGVLALGPRPSMATFDDAVLQAMQQGCGLREISRVATEAAIRVALASEDGNLQRAARRLGVTDRALQLRRAHRTD
jgi:transcriptional regulator with GAF, ATPase, and Fis domain